MPPSCLEILGPLDIQARLRNHARTPPQPYQIVKDHRTGWETGNVGAFLAGETLTDAILAALRHGHYGSGDNSNHVGGAGGGGGGGG